MKNLVFIDSSIIDVEYLFNGFNSNNDIVKYTNSTTYVEIKTALDGFNEASYKYLTFVFSYNTFTYFVENDLFFDNTENYENNVFNFIKETVDKYSINNVDFLACNLLSDNFWIHYLSYLQNTLNVTIRASENNTGNLKDGGDWVLETTQENVKALYFNENINDWTHLLDLNASHILLTLRDVLGGQTRPNLIVSWGLNNSFQLGRQTANNFGATPGLVQQSGMGNDNFEDVQQFSTGLAHSLFLLQDNTASACGLNVNGQLCIDSSASQNDFPNNTLPVVFDDSTLGDGSSVITLNNIVKVVGGETASAFLTSSGDVYVNGRNRFGEWNGTDIARAVPMPIDNTTIKYAVKLKLPTFQNVNEQFKNIFLGKNYLIALTNLKNVYSVGYNFWGQLGINSTDQTVTTFTQSVLQDGSPFQADFIDAGELGAMAIGTDGRIYVAGLGLFSSSGASQNRFFAESSFNTDTVDAGLSVEKLTTSGRSTFIIANDGNKNRLFVIGENNVGQLGLGDSTNRTTLVENNYLSTISQSLSVSESSINLTDLYFISGSRTLSLTIDIDDGTSTDRQLFTTGFGTFGQLGNGTRNSTLTPVTISYVNFPAGYQPDVSSDNPTITVQNTNTNDNDDNDNTGDGNTGGTNTVPCFDRLTLYKYVIPSLLYYKQTVFAITKYNNTGKTLYRIGYKKTKKYIIITEDHPIKYKNKTCTILDLNEDINFNKKYNTIKINNTDMVLYNFFRCNNQIDEINKIKISDNLYIYGGKCNNILRFMNEYNTKFICAVDKKIRISEIDFGITFFIHI